MEQVSMREMLNELANAPLGSPELMAEANAKAHTLQKPSPALEEVKQRCKAKWLPQGKKALVRGACNEPTAEQTDIEDAVEAAGGKRGRHGCEEPPARSPLVTVAKHNREFATLFRGEFAIAEPGYYSIFKRRRDAQVFADFVVTLFGPERLEKMEANQTVRPTRDEHDALRAEIDRLRA